MVPVTSQEPAMAFPHLLELRPLFRGQVFRDLTMSFTKCFAHPPGGIGSDLLQLRGHFIDDRRDLGHLFGS